MIKELLIKNLVSSALKVSIKILKEIGAKLLSSPEDIEQSISQHLSGVCTWAREIIFNDLKSAKRTDQVFIELDLFVYPRRLITSAATKIDKIPLLEIFNDTEHHFVILGQPGAGKTTSMKQICNKMFFDEYFQYDRFSFPVLLKLRSLNGYKDESRGPVIDAIYRILGLHVDHDSFTGSKSTLIWNHRKHLVNVLDSLKVLLILDGFDELTNNIRDQVVEDIRYLSEHLQIATMVVTSRTADFGYSINGATVFEICPMSDDQIQAFSEKWFLDEIIALDFLSQIRLSPYVDTSIRPLTLAHLCAIYEREGNIPEKPKTVYKKIINLLLEEWDQQRSVKRTSKYGNFERDRKCDFLAGLSYFLTLNSYGSVFSTNDISIAYNELAPDYGLKHNEGTQVVAELESHTGLLLQAGYQSFEFAHKSIQEYLAADHLIRLPKIPESESALMKLPNELAIAVAISSTPSAYFFELIVNRLLKLKLSEQYVKSFTSRLILEKPDFNYSTDLGLALIYLYTLYVKNNIIYNHQLSLFNYDSIILEYDNLMAIAVPQTSFDLISKNYSSGHKYPIQEGTDHIVTYHRVSKPIKPSNVFEKKLYKFPELLYIRESMLNNIPF
ncbi:NACHT domain-containing NTPase [Geobacter sp. SVR]|uniref:NACHT domain-containing protein n=1 Tax=Geobacter sp. SVR TaxID=2495594 RepID=UPI00143F01FD|nr:NACHT domain-containing protein [Geobacter sp. SVR]BCS52748.1 hypothetical protein GSVR_10560 [Geobacter sp. SVR]GCF86756.1 hypothetical protein GSbR_33560 [Geobacter sp. SVR]